MKKRKLKCEFCERGDKPKLLDEDGVLCKLSGKKGNWMHTYEDYWWPCLAPPEVEKTSGKGSETPKSEEENEKYTM